MSTLLTFIPAELRDNICHYLPVKKIHSVKDGKTYSPNLNSCFDALKKFFSSPDELHFVAKWIHKNCVNVDVHLLKGKFKKYEIQRIFSELYRMQDQSSSLTISPRCCTYDNMPALNFDCLKRLKPENRNAFFENVFEMNTLRALKIEGKIQINNIQELSKLVFLTSLDLSNIRLSEQNSPLKSLTNLTSLNLRWCGLVDEVAEQCFVSSPLKYLNFMYNDAITDKSMMKICTLTNLETLVVSGCDLLTDNSFFEIGKLTSLSTLTLVDCTFNDESLALFLKLTNLTNLNLRGAELSDRGLLLLHSFKRLNTLHLGDYSNAYISDEGLRNLPKTLTRLVLRNNFFLTPPDYIDGIKSLGLDDCDLTAEQISYLAKLNLDDLQLVGMNLAGNIEWLEQLSTLTDLDISHNSIDDKGLISISKLINLKLLSLVSNDNLTAYGLSHLTSLTNLQELDLRYCKQLTRKNISVLGGINTIHM